MGGQGGQREGDGFPFAAGVCQGQCQERPYRVLGYPIVPALFLAAVVGFLLNALISDFVATAVTFAIILAGLPVYLVAFGKKTNSHSS